MFKLLFFTALMRLPFGLIVGGLCFSFFRRLLETRYSVVLIITKLAMALLAAAAVIGIFYGSLRFGGIITFAEDNCYSYNWLDSTYRDEGFSLIYFWGSVFLGIVAAVLAERKRRVQKQGGGLP